MATVSSFPPVLNMVRSAQSGNKIMTAAWQVVFSENTTPSQTPYLLAQAAIDLSSMQVGDTIEVRVRQVLVSGGAFTNEDVLQYNNVQPANHPIARVGPLVNVFGLEIAMRQTAGVLATIPVEVYYAKVLGLS